MRANATLILRRFAHSIGATPCSSARAREGAACEPPAASAVALASNAARAVPAPAGSVRARKTASANAEDGARALFAASASGVGACPLRALLVAFVLTSKARKGSSILRGYRLGRTLAEQLAPRCGWEVDCVRASVLPGAALTLDACVLTKYANADAIALCRRLGACVVALDVIDNMALVDHTLRAAAAEAAGGDTAAVARAEYEAAGGGFGDLSSARGVDLLLTQTRSFARAVDSLGGALSHVRGRTLYHQLTNPEEARAFRSARDPSARVRVVGLLAGDRANTPSKVQLMRLARAACSAGESVRLFAVVVQGTTDVSQRNGTFVSRRREWTCVRETDGRVRALAPPAEPRVFAAASRLDQRNFYADPALDDVDVAVLWPREQGKASVREWPPTRLLFWMSRGTPAVFWHYRSCIELADDYGYAMPAPAARASGEPVRTLAAGSVEELQRALAPLVGGGADAAAARAHLRRQGLRIAAEFTESAVARRLAAILSAEHARKRCKLGPRRPPRVAGRDGVLGFDAHLPWQLAGLARRAD
ncbi:hypothetical protein KFE25_003984 [Diacronema lutheri]|uniref:Uncharacterized protein n=2 Tax=Diacronema lutheri TaxID=2081491 RepID=A0A8J5XDV7_DIALT|nr:hypothetical protein KFE25_003984 [Diacronema lutheri]